MTAAGTRTQEYNESVHAPLRLLGHPQVHVAESWQDAPPEKPFLLLAYLACSEGPVSREQLAFLFWPDSEEKKARANLRQLLKRAHRYPFAEGLRADTNTLSWPVMSDVTLFRQALGQGDWPGALTHYRGPLLDGVPVSGASGLEAWLELERKHLADAWQNAVIKQAEGDRKSVV